MLSRFVVRAIGIALATAIAAGDAAATTGFQGPYDPGVTVIQTQNGGSIDTSDAPGSITFFGGSDGSFTTSDQLYQFSLPAAGQVSFDWSYTEDDCCGAFFDEFGYQLNGVFSTLTDDFGADNQSGTFSIALAAGDVFAIDQSSFDSNSGFATTVVSNFSAPDAPVVIGGGVPEPQTWTLLLVGFGLGGTALRARRRATGYRPGA
jgi:hypothetical protein